MAVGVSSAELMKHTARRGEKKKSKSKEIEHMHIEKMDNDGYVTESHTHGKHEMCDGSCGGEKMAHKNHHGMMKHVKATFEGEKGETQEKAESLQGGARGTGEEEEFD